MNKFQKVATFLALCLVFALPCLADYYSSVGTGSGGGGLTSLTSPNNTIAIGGTLTAPTVDISGVTPSPNTYIGYNGSTVLGNYPAATGTILTGSTGAIPRYSGTNTTLGPDPNLNETNGLLAVGQTGGIQGGSIQIAGTTSGYATIVPTAAAGTPTVTLPATSSTTVIPSTLAAHNFANQVTSGGALAGAQPAFTDISGTLTNAQLPTSGVSAGSYTNVSATVNAQGVITAMSNGSGGGGGTGSTNQAAYFSATNTISGTGPGNQGQSFQANGSSTAPAFADTNPMPNIACLSPRVFGMSGIAFPTATSFSVSGIAGTFSASGTFTSATDSQGAWINGLTGSVANNAALGYMTLGTSFRQSPRLIATIKTGASPTDIQNCRIFVGFSDTASPTVDSPPNNIASVTYGPGTDGTAFWRTYVSNTSASTRTATTQSIAYNTEYTIAVDCSNQSSYVFYINGNPVGTVTTTLPSSTTQVFPVCFIETTTTSGVNMKLKNIFYDQL